MQRFEWRVMTEDCHLRWPFPASAAGKCLKSCRCGGGGRHPKAFVPSAVHFGSPTERRIAATPTRNDRRVEHLEVSNCDRRSANVSPSSAVTIAQTQLAADEKNNMYRFPFFCGSRFKFIKSRSHGPALRLSNVFQHSSRACDRILLGRTTASSGLLSNK